MDVVNIASYVHFGSHQYPVEISLIRSTALIEHVREAGASTFERSYTGLTEASMDFKVKENFDGFDLWGAVRKTITYYSWFPTQGAAGFDAQRKIWDLLGLYVKRIEMDEQEETYDSSLDFIDCDAIVNVLAQEYNRIDSSNWMYATGNVLYSGTQIVNRVNTSAFIKTHHRIYQTGTKYLYISVVPDDYILNGVVNPAYIENPSQNELYMEIRVNMNAARDTITSIVFSEVRLDGLSAYNNFFQNITTPDYAQNIDDPENPYGDPGTSTPGGGDGDYGDPDSVDPTEVPDLPTASAATTGFITIYNPTQSDLSSLGNYLWSNLFDLNTFKKMFSDPMECIISLGIVPCVPNSGGSQNIMFGNIDTGVNCTFLSTQYAKVDCGSVSLTKYVGSFMDYSPYVKVQLFLPYIGFIHLGTDDIMGGSINVTYHVDVLSGDCIAFITHSSKGVLYSYTGNCLTNVPVTAANYASSLRNYYESVLGIIPSTANGAMSGGAAGAAAGAMSGALSAASNIVLNTKPDFQRSGSLGGSSGIMGVQKPFIIIERPNISVPNKVQHYMGQTSNMTASLGGLSGMTIVEAVHLEGIPCTTSELAEIESILHQGVIL